MTWIKSLVVSIFCAGSIWAQQGAEIGIWGAEFEAELEGGGEVFILKGGYYYEFRSDGILVVNGISSSNIPGDEQGVIDGWASTYSVVGDSLFISARIFFNNYHDAEVFDIVICDGDEGEGDECDPEDFEPSAVRIKVDSVLGSLFF